MFPCTFNEGKLLGGAVQIVTVHGLDCVIAEEGHDARGKLGELVTHHVNVDGQHLMISLVRVALLALSQLLQGKLGITEGQWHDCERNNFWL